MKIEASAFIATRKTDGRIWADTTTLSLTIWGVDDKVKKTDAEIPKWAKYSPFVEIIPVTISGESS